MRIVTRPWAACRVEVLKRSLVGLDFRLHGAARQRDAGDDEGDHRGEGGGDQDATGHGDPPLAGAPSRAPSEIKDARPPRSFRPRRRDRWRARRARRGAQQLALVARDPRGAQPGALGAVDVPPVSGDHPRLAGRGAELGQRVLVDARIGLVGADRVGADHRLEVLEQAGGLEGGARGVGGAVGQRDRCVPGRAQRLEGATGIWIGRQRGGRRQAAVDVGARDLQRGAHVLGKRPCLPGQRVDHRLDDGQVQDAQPVLAAGDRRAGPAACR